MQKSKIARLFKMIELQANFNSSAIIINKKLTDAKAMVGMPTVVEIIDETINRIYPP